MTVPITTADAALILAAWTPSTGGGGSDPSLTTGTQTILGQKSFAEDIHALKQLIVDQKTYLSDVQLYGTVTANDSTVADSLRSAAGGVAFSAGTDVALSGLGTTASPLSIASAMVVPPDPNALAAGVSTIPRWNPTSAALSCNTGELRLTFFTPRKSFTATQLSFKTGSTAAAATPTLCKMGLYSVDPASGDLTLIGATASDTATMFRATQTVYTVSMLASASIVAGSRYAIGPLIVTSAASANFCGIGPTLAAAQMLAAPTLSAIVTGQTDLPSSILAGALGATTQIFYGAVLP